MSLRQGIQIESPKMQVLFQKIFILETNSNNLYITNVNMPGNYFKVMSLL